MAACEESGLSSYSKGLSGTDKSLTESGVKNRKKVGSAVMVEGKVHYLLHKKTQLNQIDIK
jgi:hypothetical protein